MKRPYALRETTRQRTKHNSPKTTLKTKKKSEKNVRQEVSCDPCEESKEHNLNKDEMNPYLEEDKSHQEKLSSNQLKSPFAEMFKMPVNCSQPLIISEPPWSLDETLILSLALYKANGDLRYLIHLFPGKDVYRHVLSAITRVADSIKYKNLSGVKSFSQIQKLELFSYMGMILNGIKGDTPIPEVSKIVQYFQIEENDCFEFLDKIQPEVKFSHQVFQEFIERTMEAIENKINELSGNSGNLKGLMNLRNSTEEHPFPFPGAPQLQYYPMPYMPPYGLFSFWWPFPVPSYHL